MSALMVFEKVGGGGGKKKKLKIGEGVGKAIKYSELVSHSFSQRGRHGQESRNGEG